MSVSNDVVAKFTQLATPTLANALDDVAFEGVFAGLAQMVPGTRCVGRAVTVREGLTFSTAMAWLRCI